MAELYNLLDRAFVEGETTILVYEIEGDRRGQEIIQLTLVISGTQSWENRRQETRITRGAICRVSTGRERRRAE